METKQRRVFGVFRGAPHHWVGDGFRVSNYFPSNRLLIPRVSPFFFLDYHTPHVYQPTSAKRGVGPHPHRGIETVTIAIEGSIAHHDSRGHHDVIHPGDVQWMTAGAGILHAEYHGPQFAATGGPFHMLQLWVNLHRAHKMTPPAYQAIAKGMIPVVPVDQGVGDVRIIAGSHGGVAGPARTLSPIDLYEVRLEERSRVILDLPSHHNVAVLVVQGHVRGNAGANARALDLMVFETEEKDRPRPLVLEGATGSTLAYVLSGEPLDEPIVAHGPFVMNTAEEIEQAYADYANGVFGVLKA